MLGRINSRGRVAALLTLAAATLAPTVSAEIIYMSIREKSAADPKDILLTFDSATPGTVNSLGEITGLGNLQYLEDIDFRPATGELYGLGYTGSVYKIDINTLAGVSQGFIVGSPGSGYVGGGIDFNPVTDVLRVVDGQTATNAHFNPITNTGIIDAGGLTYAVADPNAAGTSHEQSVAFSNNVAGALATTAYGIDLRSFAVSGVLNTINPEAAGTLNTIGNLGITADDVGGFDISGATGVAYVVLNDFVAGQYIPTLYTINLTTGAATAVGPVGIDLDVYRVTGISVAPDNIPGGGPGNAPLPLAVLAGPAIGALAIVVRRRAKH